jgi:hypothetical protein
VFLKNYLVVEVAIYPEFGKQVSAAHSRFRLRLNGSKGATWPVSVGMVAASLRYPDWERERELTVQAGPMIIGRAPVSSRFPGDPEASRRSPPPPVHTDKAPVADETVRDEDLIAELALREGPTAHPVSGYLYFAYKGKVEKLRTVELLYEAQPDSNPVVLRLR